VLLAGSRQTPVSVILDTGSSALAIQQTHYKATKGVKLEPTSPTQDVVYGSGGRAGAVVDTTLTMGKAAGAYPSRCQ
jgi:hypothetical protein